MTTLKLLWWLISRMAVMMGMLLSACMSTLFVLTAIPAAMQSTYHLVIAGWALISAAHGLVLFLEHMAKDSRRQDNRLRVIAEAERIIKKTPRTITPHASPAARI